MSQQLPEPIYYAGVSQAEMERRLRNNYLTSSGWLESAEAKFAVREGKPVPWITYAAMSFLEGITTPDLSVFEYGGGQSTLYWASRVRRVVSVDHDPRFEAHVRRELPGNAEFFLLPEAAPLVGEAVAAVRRPSTESLEPLDANFESYALKILDFAPDTFDMVIVDGRARVLSTWAAIEHFKTGGFVVFDNSDRDVYQRAYEMLDDAGYRRIDFWGMGPINPYPWCTSVFYHPRRFPGTQWFRPTKPSGGRSLTPNNPT